jgi:TctA family transporter
MMEENLRRALLLAQGSWATFVTRPLSAGLLVAAALLVVVVMLPSISRRRDATFKEEAR